MRKKLCILLGIMIFVTVAGFGVTIICNDNTYFSKNKNNKFTIVTSFYPMYIAASNIVDGIDDVELINLTENQSGCVHDYQVTTKDMKKLSNADVLIINGGGIESFITEIAKQYPELKIIDTSENIPLLNNLEGHFHDGESEGEEHDHNEEGEHHNHGEYNAHLWMSPSAYQLQVHNIVSGLVELDVEHKELYENNGIIYENKIANIKKEIDELKVTKEVSAIIFHDAFAYLLNELVIKVECAIEIEGENSLSAGDIAEVINEVNAHKIDILISEKQNSPKAPNQIANETGAKVYIMDSLVTGDDNKDAYIQGMKKNIDILKSALE